MCASPARTADTRICVEQSREHSQLTPPSSLQNKQGSHVRSLCISLHVLTCSFAGMETARPPSSSAVLPWLCSVYHSRTPPACSLEGAQCRSTVSWVLTDSLAAAHSPDGSGCRGVAVCCLPKAEASSHRPPAARVRSTNAPKPGVAKLKFVWFLCTAARSGNSGACVHYLELGTRISMGTRVHYLERDARISLNTP